MATPDQQKKFDDLKKALQDLNRDTALFEKRFQDVQANVAETENLLRTMTATLRGANQESFHLTENFRESLSLVTAINDALRKKSGNIAQASKAMQGLESIGNTLLYEVKELDSLDEKRLKNLVQEGEHSLRVLGIQTETIRSLREAQGINATEEGLRQKSLELEKRLLENKEKLQRLGTKGNEDRKKELKDQIEKDTLLKSQLIKESEIIAAYDQQKEAYQSILNAAKQRLSLEEKTNSTFGLSGAAMKGLSTLAGKFGMSHIVGQLEDIHSKLKNDIRQAIEENATVEYSEGGKVQRVHVDSFNQRIKQLQEEQLEVRKAHEEKQKLFDRYISKHQELIDKLKQQYDTDKNLTDARKKEIEKELELEDQRITALKNSSLVEDSNYRILLNQKQAHIDNIKSSASVEYHALGIGQKFGFAFESIKKMGGALVKGVLDPLFLITSISRKLWSSFLDVNKASVEYGRLAGVNATAIAGANSQLATSVQFLETAADITKQVGMNALSIMPSETLAQAAEFKNTLGLAGEEAGKLAVISQSTGQNLRGMTEAIVDTTSAYNATNRSAVSQGQILKDIAKTSDSVKASLGSNPKLLAEAASAARRLGMELNQVDKIADSLMNFESSIENELEAQLLTGKNINLAKARELALSNDLAGLGKELFKNSADLQEFGKMNRIQQEAYAKSLGMSKDELAKIAYNRAIESKMTKEQAAAAAGVNLADMERVAIQEKLKIAVDKLAQAFAPVFEVVGLIADGLATIIKPIAGVIGWVMKLSSELGKLGPLLVVLGTAFAFKGGRAALSALLGKIKGIGTAASLSATKVKSLLGMGSAPVSAETVTSKAGAAVSKTATAPVGDMASKASAAAKAGQGASPAAGVSIKKFLTNLASGMKKMADPKVFIGAGGLVATAMGFAVLTIGIPSMLFVAAFGPFVNKGLQAIGRGMKSLGTAAAAPQFKSGIGALALLGLALIPLGFALKLTAPAIEAFGKVITSVFTGLAGLVTAVANGFVTMLGAITPDKIEPLLDLGPALIGVSIGIGVLAATSLVSARGLSLLGRNLRKVATPLSVLRKISEQGDISSISQSLKELSTSSEGLRGVANALELIAAQLIKVGIAGKLASSFTKILSGLQRSAEAPTSPSSEKEVTGTSSIASRSAITPTAVSSEKTGIAPVARPVQAVTITPEKQPVAPSTASGSTTPLAPGNIDAQTSVLKNIAEGISSLIAEVRKGKDIYMDGHKVGEAIGLGAVRS